LTAFLAPCGLIVGLGLSGGGFEVVDRHIAGLCAWLVVVALIVFGAASSARIGRPLYLIAGLLGSLVIWSALSSFWSGSVELSVIEADRVLVYLGFFLAAFLLAQTAERRERFAEGIAIGFAIVVLAGLGSRLLPHVIEVTDGLGSGSRLRYPLGYWNANATMCGITVAMLLWMSRGSRWDGLRWLSVGLVPATLLTLYFTYSRGGLVSLAIACACLIALSADRLWLLGTLALGGLGALPALLAVQARDGIANNSLGQATVDQGVTVLLILLAGTALSLGLFALLRRLERDRGPRTDRAVSLSRNPVLLKRVALAGAVVAVIAVALVGGRAWDQFSSSEVQVPTQDPAQHLANFSGTGRHDFWRVAVDAFEEEPLIGHGAGTYVFSWDELRSIYLPAIDAHSLYLETFAELGIVGGLLILGFVLSAIWVAFSAWRAAPPERREAQAALLAAMVAFAVAAGFDWFWEIAGLGAVFLLAAGAMTAARCEQLQAAPVGGRGGRGFGLAISGLALAWIAALALIGPLLVEHEIESSESAVDRGDLTSAADHADTARSIEPWAASPYVQLGLVAERAGEMPRAVELAGKAIEREERNWVLYALRSRFERENDDPAAARHDFEEARRLNPLAPREQQEGR
jgi:O-antigen ligase/polysaccharide polymerase Wzy-like membrane protein